MAVEVAQAQGGTVERAEARSEAWWVFPAVPLLAAAIAFTWTLHGELQRLYGMTGSAWDFAYDQQVIWNVSQGQGFYSSFARANFLGIHFELIFVALAAVERFWPSPTVLLIFSSAGLAAAGPAAYLFFRAILPAGRRESAWLSVALAAPIPFWFAIQEAARDFFHPENMAFALALLAAWAGLRGRRVLMWVFCILTLMCKEDQVYTVGVIAVLMSQYGAPEVKKHWRFILYLAIFWFLIGTGVVQQHFRANGYTDFIYYRWLFGLDPTLPLSPLSVLAALTRPAALIVMATMFASLAGMPIFAPRWLLLLVPPYLANVLSGHDPQYALALHYGLLLLFPFTVAAGVGARNFLLTRTIKPEWALLAVVPALLLGFVTGRFPPALRSDPGLYSHPNTVAELQAATAMIPAGAPVQADDGLAVWLANRHTINDFPDKLVPADYVVIDRQAYISGPTHPDERLAALQSLPGSGRSVLYDDGRFIVWSPVGGD